MLKPLLFATATLIPVMASAETVHVKTDDGTEVELFAAGPVDAERGILVIHDWFGLSLTTKAAATRFGNNKMRAVAVDLYGQPFVKTHSDAQALMDQLDHEEVQARIAAALGFLEGEVEDRQLAIVGYSMGAGPALDAAIAGADSIDAAVLVYGGGYADIPDERLAEAPPILTVSGDADDWAYGELVALSARARDQNLTVDALIIGGARHAFTQPLFDNGASFDRHATATLRSAIDVFLARELGAAP